MSKGLPMLGGWKVSITLSEILEMSSLYHHAKTSTEIKKFLPRMEGVRDKERSITLHGKQVVTCSKG